MIFSIALLMHHISAQNAPANKVKSGSLFFLDQRVIQTF